MIRITTAKIPDYLKKLLDVGLDYRIVAIWVERSYQIWIEIELGDENDVNYLVAIVWHQSGNRPRTMKKRSTVENYLHRLGIDTDKLKYQEDWS